MTTHQSDSNLFPTRRAATSPRGVRFGLWKSILYTIIIVTSFFVIIELSVRTWAYFFRTEYERFDPKSETFVLIPGEYDRGSSKLVINKDGFVGNELKRDAPGLLRIYTMGDSCTFGDGDSSSTYSVLLEQMLAARKSNGLTYEVVNGGIEGADSEMALRRLKARAPELMPQIVIIYIGWNDLMKHDPTAQDDSKRWAGVARALDSLWISKALKKVIFFYLRPNLAAPGVGPDSKRGLFADFSPTFYENNLRETIAFVRSMGARPLVVTLPTVVTESMTLDDIKRANVIFPYYRSAYSVGDLLDLVAAYNRSIKNIAQTERVPLVDLATVFARLENRKPYFLDTMHPSREGREIIVAEVYAGLLRDGMLEPNRTQNAPASAAQ